MLFNCWVKNIYLNYFAVEDVQFSGGQLLQFSGGQLRKEVWKKSTESLENNYFQNYNLISLHPHWSLLGQTPQQNFISCLWYNTSKSGGTVFSPSKDIRYEALYREHDRNKSDFNYDFHGTALWLFQNSAVSLEEMFLAFDLLVKNGGGGKDQRDYGSCLVLYMFCSVQ